MGFREKRSSIHSVGEKSRYLIASTTKQASFFETSVIDA
jgi:hypothetical protein